MTRFKSGGSLKSRKHTRGALTLAVLFAGAGALQAGTTILSNENLDAIDQRVQQIVDKMTLDEKILFMHGNKEGLKYDGLPPIPRVGIPEYTIAHGPYGARSFFSDAKAGRRVIKPGTFMSCSINYAACWDPELVCRIARGMGVWLSEELPESGDGIKADEWAAFRVLVQGNNIKTWINGKQVADLTSNKVAPEGIIGLQVHGYPRGKKRAQGAEKVLSVDWRNIKIRALD
jgi:hypothetical protein